MDHSFSSTKTYIPITPYDNISRTTPQTNFHNKGGYPEESTK